VVIVDNAGEESGGSEMKMTRMCVDFETARACASDIQIFRYFSTSKLKNLQRQLGNEENLIKSPVTSSPVEVRVLYFTRDLGLLLANQF